MDEWKVMYILQSKWLFQLFVIFLLDYCKWSFGSSGNRLWAEINMQEVYVGLPLRSVTTRGRGKKQNWAEGEVELWCCPSAALSPPHWELWTWGGSLELLWVKAKVLGIYVPSWSIFAYVCPEKEQTVGKGSSQLSHFLKIVCISAFCQQQSQ